VSPEHLLTGVHPRQASELYELLRWEQRRQETRKTPGQCPAFAVLAEAASPPGI